MDLEKKIEKIKKSLRNKKVLIAFSGGADSSLVAKIAKDVSKEALTVTIDNGVLPPEFISNAQKIAQEIGIKNVIIKENFLNDTSFKMNPPHRCYICKEKMYSLIEREAKKLGFDVIADGTNISDLLEDRPGIMITFEKKVLSPLLLAGMRRGDVLNALKIFDINYSKSTTCLATRIYKGEEITPKKINRINYAESLIKNIAKVDVVRVRAHNDQASIEVDDIEKILDIQKINHIKDELSAVGFKRIKLDISGYNNKEKEIAIYKPCKDEKNKIMFETELPYQIDIEKTFQSLSEIGEIKCSLDMGIIMIEIENRNITIFRNGKIVARRVKDKEDAEKVLIEVLPRIRRII
ncbi:MAG: ATP-dependent sacrificial sulfur transferase LarE [Methanomicrobiales archaeon]